MARPISWASVAVRAGFMAATRLPHRKSGRVSSDSTENRGPASGAVSGMNPKAEASSMEPKRASQKGAMRIAEKKNNDTTAKVFFLQSGDSPFFLIAVISFSFSQDCAAHGTARK